MLKQGWEELLAMAFSPDDPPHKIETCRRMFYSGAAHLYFGVMKGLSPGIDTVTTGDLELLAAVEAELEEFRLGILGRLETTGRAQ